MDKFELFLLCCLFLDKDVRNISMVLLFSSYIEKQILYKTADIDYLFYCLSLLGVLTTIFLLLAISKRANLLVIITTYFMFEIIFLVNFKYPLITEYSVYLMLYGSRVTKEILFWLVFSSLHDNKKVSMTMAFIWVYFTIVEATGGV